MFALIAQKITNPAISAEFGATESNVALANVIATIWRTAITLGGLALLVMLIMGALNWITAGGDKGKIEAARDRITQSIIGMLILAGTVAISLFIGTMLKINLLQPNFADNLGGQTQQVGQGCGGGAACIPPLFCQGGVCVTP